MRPKKVHTIIKKEYENDSDLFHDNIIFTTDDGSVHKYNCMSYITIIGENKSLMIDYAYKIKANDTVIITKKFYF